MTRVRVSGGKSETPASGSTTAVSGSPVRPGDSGVDRLITLVYSVARRVGMSRRSAERLCVRHVAAGLPGRAPGSAADARLVRSRVVRAVRSELLLRNTARVVDEALADAVLLDELALLPPRQQFAVRSVVLQGRSLSEVVVVTGWTREQAIKLLNAGMSSITRMPGRGAPAV